MSPSDNLMQINGFWVDLAIVESTLIVALSSYSLISVKLVSSPSSSRLALFFTSLTKVDELPFLRAAREVLLTCPSFPEPLAATISFANQLTEMPVDEDGDVNIPALRSIAERRWEARRSYRRSRPVINNVEIGPASPGLPSPSARRPGSARVAPVPPSSASAFRPPTFPSVPDIPTITIHSPDFTPTPAAESFSPRFGTTPTCPPPTQPSSVMGISLRSEIALEIASHATTLLSLPASSSVPTHLPLKLAGLNSVATAQLYFWLQERYEYNQDIAGLFEDNISAEVIASHIVGTFRHSPPHLAPKLNPSVIQVALLLLCLVSLLHPLLPQGPQTLLTPRSSSSPPARISIAPTTRPVSPTNPTKSNANPRFTPSIPTPSATFSSPG